jgi:hypothetical protein
MSLLWVSVRRERTGDRPWKRSIASLIYCTFCCLLILDCRTVPPLVRKKSLKFTVKFFNLESIFKLTEFKSLNWLILRVGTPSFLELDLPQIFPQKWQNVLSSFSYTSIAPNNQIPNNINKTLPHLEHQCDCFAQFSYNNCNSSNPIGICHSSIHRWLKSQFAHNTPSFKPLNNRFHLIQMHFTAHW